MFITARPLIIFSLLNALLLAPSAFARPVLDCQMKANPCTMAGATVTLPWSSIPDAQQYPFRQQMSAPFEIAYGYHEATGDFSEGQTIIRDQDPQMGAYWGFLPNGEKTYFAMIAGSSSTGYKLGVKGCESSPRVWSSSCRLTTEEALQQEIYQLAGISNPNQASLPSSSSAPTPFEASLPQKCYFRVEQPYMYYVLEFTEPNKAYLEMKYYGGGRDGYQLTLTDKLGPNSSIYKDPIFDMNLKVENQGSVRIVRMNENSSSPYICRESLDTNGLRSPLPDEVP